MKPLFFLSHLLFLSFSHSTSQATPPPHTLHLFVGEQRFLPLPDLSHFTVGDSKLLKIAPTPYDQSGILVRALKSGHSNLLLWTSDTRSPHSLSITVHKPSKSTAAPLLPLLPPLSEAQAALLPESVWIYGTLSNSKEWLALLKWTQIDPSKVRFGLTLSGEAFQTVSNQIRSTLKKACPHTALHNIQSKAGFLLLSPSGASCNLSLDTFKALHPDVRWASQTGVHTPLLIRIFLLEGRRKSHNPIHLNLLKYPFSLQDFKTALEGLDQEIRILSQPELVTQATGVSELFLGGEVPIRKVTRMTTSYQHRPFGLKVSLETKGFEEGRLRIHISTEITDIEPELTIDETPGFQAHRVSTEVLAPLSQPILLGGLSHIRNQTSHRGLPWIRKIPILRSFLAEQSQDTESSELSLMLVPEPWISQVRLDSWHTEVPIGFRPPPRHYLSPSQIEHLKHSKDYPWNALSLF